VLLEKKMLDISPMLQVTIEPISFSRKVTLLACTFYDGLANVQSTRITIYKDPYSADQESSAMKVSTREGCSNPK
jgi:hypothetical protein